MALKALTSSNYWFEDNISKVILTGKHFLCHHTFQARNPHSGGGDPVILTGYVYVPTFVGVADLFCGCDRLWGGNPQKPSLMRWLQPITNRLNKFVCPHQ